MMMNIYISRSLRGNVDRNLNHLGKPVHILRVVPYVGTWIEIRMMMLFDHKWASRSLRGNVDRNYALDDYTMAQVCRSLRGNVDRNRKR